MLPRRILFGRGRQTCLSVGVVGRGEPQITQTVPTCFDHAIQRGQIVAVLDGVLRGAQYDRSGIGVERLKPKPFDLAYLLGIRPGRVILVVVVQPKERENLIDRLDQLRVRRCSRISWPSWCR